MRYEISRECPLGIPRLSCSDYSDIEAVVALADDDRATRRFLRRPSPFRGESRDFFRTADRDSVARLGARRIIILIPPMISRGDDTSAAATDGKIRYKAQPCAPAIKILALRSDHRAAYVIGQIRSHDYEEPRRSRTALPGCNRRVQGSRLQGSPGFTGECSRQLTYDP